MTTRQILFKLATVILLLISESNALAKEYVCHPDVCYAGGNCDWSASFSNSKNIPLKLKLSNGVTYELVRVNGHSALYDSKAEFALPVVVQFSFWFLQPKKLTVTGPYYDLEMQCNEKSSTN